MSSTVLISTIVGVIFVYSLYRFFLSLNKEDQELNEAPNILVSNEKELFFDEDRSFQDQFVERGGIELIGKLHKKISEERLGHKVDYLNTEPETSLEIDDSFENILEWGKYERREGNFILAIKIVDMGLDKLMDVDMDSFVEENEYNKEFGYLFYSIRSKANVGLNKLKDALTDQKSAFKLVKINNPENHLVTDIFFSRLIAIKAILDSNK